MSKQLYSFKGCYDFCTPASNKDGSDSTSLIEGRDGNFYGTTYSGGTHLCDVQGTVYGCGTIFKLTPAGVETVLYNFNGLGAGNTDSAQPKALIQAADGNFFGLTSFGGANLAACCDGGDDGGGTVFLLSHPTWSPGRASPP